MPKAPMLSEYLSPSLMKAHITKILSHYSIVAIPGLGADPRNCWVSDVTSFDWLTDDHGLRSQFHHTNTENGRVSARVLLYLSETAWQGRLRVKADLYDLAYALLEGLRSNREANVCAI